MWGGGGTLRLITEDNLASKLDFALSKPQKHTKVAFRYE